jgi:hypothetical protein
MEDFHQTIYRWRVSSSGGALLGSDSLRGQDRHGGNWLDCSLLGPVFN